MIRSALTDLIRHSVEALIRSGAVPEAIRSASIEIADPKSPEHGDFATNLAMTAAKLAGTSPRALAEMLASQLETHAGVIDSAEVAGPGFINLWLNKSFVTSWVKEVIGMGPDGLKTAESVPNPRRINVEFVSVNPNGPITIGSGRGAAFGSTLCNVLEAVGHTVHREYYINDGVNSEQMRLFAESVRAICTGQPVPENGYKGDYVQEVARGIAVRFPNDLNQDTAWYQQQSQTMMIEAQRQSLADFGVHYDTWFSEQSLHDSGAVGRAIEHLRAIGSADERPFRTKLKLAKGGKIEEVIREDQPADEDDAEGSGATLWLRSTRFGDDMDRVLRRKDGRLTYIASDVAYHYDKLSRPERGNQMITVLGPDHHGYVGRLTAVVAAMKVNPVAGSAPAESELYRSAEDEAACQDALAFAKQTLSVAIYQLVRFMKDGKPAPMRKRDGNIYALSDLMSEIGAKLRPNGSRAEQIAVGRDVARFFYLMRHHDTTFDFDLNLAETQSEENPVFYAQYAHARICSILGKAEESGLKPNTEHASLLVHDKEQALIRKLCELPSELVRSAEDYGVHRIATHSVELARTFHAFYDACKVIQTEAADLTSARLALCEATRIALVATFDVLGVSAPSQM